MGKTVNNVSNSILNFVSNIVLIISIDSMGYVIDSYLKVFLGYCTIAEDCNNERQYCNNSACVGKIIYISNKTFEIEHIMSLTA